MSKPRKPTVYLFVNKDSASVSLSRCHGKDASAILSHVQSCRNQKNKQLHMFRIETTPESPKLSESSTPDASPRASPTSPSISLSKVSSPSTSATSASPEVVSDLPPASPHSQSRGTVSEIDELVHYFDTLWISERRGSDASQEPDLYHQIVSTEAFQNFHGRTAARSVHGYALLACTAAKMSTDFPSRRKEFSIKATTYMQPSLQCLREQLANPQGRTLTGHQILLEMLLHCVTNWYLRDYPVAETHLSAMRHFTGCLDVSRTADRKLMDVIKQCNLLIRQRNIQAP